MERPKKLTTEQKRVILKTHLRNMGVTRDIESGEVVYVSLPQLTENKIKNIKDDDVDALYASILKDDRGPQEIINDEAVGPEQVGFSDAYFNAVNTSKTLLPRTLKETIYHVAEVDN